MPKGILNMYIHTNIPINIHILLFVSHYVAHCKYYVPPTTYCNSPLTHKIKNNNFAQPTTKSNIQRNERLMIFLSALAQ